MRYAGVCHSPGNSDEGRGGTGGRAPRGTAKGDRVANRRPKREECGTSSVTRATSGQLHIIAASDSSTTTGTESNIHTHSGRNIHIHTHKAYMHAYIHASMNYMCMHMTYTTIPHTQMHTSRYIHACMLVWMHCIHPSICAPIRPSVHAHMHTNAHMCSQTFMHTKYTSQTESNKSGGYS